MASPPVIVTERHPLCLKTQCNNILLHGTITETLLYTFHCFSLSYTGET